MKIAILGTRGIPNNHGGFEQFAEYLSRQLFANGNEVFVYNSHSHPYQNTVWNGVNIIHKKDPEEKIGTIGQFIYDFNCILDSRRRNFDVILQLGYTSSSIWGWFLPKNSTIVTNMDGLEWKRSKYSKPVRSFLKIAERLAVKTSDYLISDSIGIKTYLKEKYGLNSEFIPYGADFFENPDSSIISNYNVNISEYNMLIARLEPENNIEVILDGVVKSEIEYPFLVVGKHKTKFGEYLKNKYRHNKNVRFLGGIYDQNHLNNLRYYSNLYFHGHSVGGTNPSLLEAMASNSLIVAHDNIFNRSILNDDAMFFKDSEDVKLLLKKRQTNMQSILDANSKKIRTLYSWSKINTDYETFIQDCLKRGKN